MRIKNWQNYEHPDSRKCSTMPWVKTKTSHDGLGYLMLMDHPDGLAHFGAWVLILQTSANCPRRGLLLTDSGRPLGARELALKTRGCARMIADAIPRLVEVGWLEWVEVDTSGGVTPVPADAGVLGPLGDGAIRELPGNDSRPEERREEGEKKTPSPSSPRALPHLPEQREAATATTALAKRISGVDSHRVRDAVTRGDVLEVIAAFNGNRKADRDAEWLREVDGMQLGVVAAIFAWRRFEREPIREPSGFRRARVSWRELDQESKGVAIERLREFGLPVPGAAA